ncbi:MAG: hypothetical protein ACK56F_10680, partial [bacterium]
AWSLRGSFQIHHGKNPPQAEIPYWCLCHGTSAGIMNTRGPMILPDCVDPQQRPVRPWSLCNFGSFFRHSTARTLERLKSHAPGPSQQSSATNKTTGADPGQIQKRQEFLPD